MFGMGTAHAGEVAGPDASIVWKPREVRYPVAPSAVRPDAPFVPANAGAVMGPIEIAPERAAALWVDALDIVRVRRVAGAGDISLTRVIGSRARAEARGRAEIAEPATAVGAGVWHIVQPPAGGDVWVISAPRPVTVVVEHATRQQSSALWEKVRGDILRWIDQDGAVPRIPLVTGGSALRLGLRADRALGRLLEAGWSRAHSAEGKGAEGSERARFERAVRAWRKASALIQLDTVGSRWQPYHLRRSLTRELAERVPSEAEVSALASEQEDGDLALRSDRPYARIDGDQMTWKLVLEGPGILEIDLRARVGEAGRHETRTLDVRAAGRTLAHRVYHSREARVRAADVGPADAFPRLVRLLTRDRELVGLRERVRVPLLSGTHTYAIALQGGPSLVRARMVQRRPRLAEYLRGQASPDDWMAIAEGALAGDASAEGALLIGMLGTLRGASPGQMPAPGLRSRLLRLVAETERLRGRAAEPARMGELLRWALPLLDGIPSGVDPALGWMLRRDLARIALRAGLSGAVLALAAPATGSATDSAAELAAPILAELASMRLEADPTPEAFSWSLAAAHRAWQRTPLDPAVRSTYRRIWRWQGTWSRLRPVMAPAASESGSPAHDYLMIEPAAAEPRGKGPVILDERELWRARGGTPHRVFAPPSRFDQRRPMLLQAYVLVPPAARGTVALHVDDRVFHTVPLEPVERLSVAVAPGAHEVRVEGPPGTEAFLSLGPESLPPGGQVQRARLRRIRPIVSDQHAMRYILPTSHRGVPLRIDLRAVMPADRPKTPLRVTLRTDAGPARTFVLDTRATDSSLIALDGAPALSPLVQAVLWLPPEATQLWFETDPAARILARIAIRERQMDAPADAAGPDARGPDVIAAPGKPRSDAREEDAPEAKTWSHGDPRWDAITDQIAGLSRQLVMAPDDPALLLERAHRLLDIGQGGHARVDLARLDALGPERLSPEQARLRDRVEERLKAWRDDRYLPLQPQDMAHPMAMAPGSLALVDGAEDLHPWAEVARAVRRSRDRTSLYRAAQRSDSLLARYYRADMLRREGQLWQAAQALRALYEDTGQPQIGVEALLAFEAALDAGESRDRPGGASLVYGLALEIRQRLVHPVVERVLFAAARTSRWESIRNTDSNAGFERLYLDQSESEPGPITDVKQSLLAAPWPVDDAHVIEPGRGALLHVDLARPAVIRPQVWCRRIKAPPEDSVPRCPVRWRVDSGPSQAARVPLVQETTLGAVPLPAGRHRIAVSLDQGDDSILLAVRFVANRTLNGRAGGGHEATVPVRRPGRLYVAKADRPVRITVLGPTTLRVQARRYDDDPPVLVDVEAVPEGEGRVRAHTVRIDTPRDEAASSDAERQVHLSRPVTSTLVLPEEVVYRVSVRPQSGQALVRLGRREDRPRHAETPAPSDGAETPLPPQAAAAVAASPWPAQPVAQGSLAGRTWRPRRDPLWPTLSLGLQFRRDDLEERDISDQPLENRFQLDLAWRRQVMANKAWVRLHPALRWHPGLTPSYGLRADLDLRRLPLGLGIDVSGRVFAQSVLGVFAWAAQGQLRVTRSLRVHPSIVLAPSLSLRARHYSLDPTRAPAAALDPLVYNDYGRVHRYALQPRAKAYWWAFQDQVAFATAQLLTNEDLRTIDHVRLGIGWRGIIEWQRIRAPLFQVEYEPNLRLGDQHRSSSYLRHDIGLGLEWSLWQGGTGRLVLELRDDLYLSNLVGNRNVFLVGIRYDFTGGRGLRDMLPSERRFNDLIERGQWAD